MKKSLVLLTIVFSCIHVFAQKVDKKLQKEVEDAIKGFNGTIGVYIKNIKNNKTVMMMMTIAGAASTTTTTALTTLSLAFSR